MTFANQLAQLTQQTCEHLTARDVGILQKATRVLRQSSIIEKSLQIGESVPNFSWVDENGQQISFDEFVKNGPVVINFFRGFWCSFCREELSAYQCILDKLESRGIQYLAISPDSSQQETPTSGCIKDTNNEIAKKFRIAYELSEDQRRLFGDQFGLNLPDIHRSELWELPIPATYLINEDRVVSNRFLDADYRKRIDPLEILAHIESEN